MPSTVEQLSPTRAKLTVEIPFADLKPALDKAYKQIASQVNIPGFRKGKVPAAVIDQRVGRGAVLQEAINEVLPDAYGQAIAEHKLAPLGQPDIDITRLEDGEVVEFVAEVDVRPEFDLPDFSAISVSVDAAEVSDEDIEQRIDMLRDRFATVTEVDRAAEAGDVVTIDLSATRDGDPLPDATADGLTYEIGSGEMLDGLDEAVTGLSAGEKATFTSTLLGGEYKDQDAEIEVTVTKVSSKELPEVDDEFAQLVSQFDTVEEMRSDLVKAVEQMARVSQANAARDQVLEGALALTDFELPEALLAHEVEARTEQVRNQLQQAGLTIEQYLEQAGDSEEADTADEFWANLAAQSERAMRAQILLDVIADTQEIGIDQQDLTSLLFRKAQENNTSPEQELQHMQEHNHLPEWMGEIRRSKALALIVESATVTDPEGNTVDFSELRADGTLGDDEEGDAESADSPDSPASPDSPDSPASPASES